MSMTLLVPLDGSQAAEQALPTVRAIARRADARVILVRAVPISSFPIGHRPEKQFHLEQEAQQYLASIARQLATEGIQVQQAAPSGDVAEEILAAISVWQPDLVVIASHGRTGLSQLLYG